MKSVAEGEGILENKGNEGRTGLVVATGKQWNGRMEEGCLRQAEQPMGARDAVERGFSVAIWTEGRCCRVWHTRRSTRERGLKGWRGGIVSGGHDGTMKAPKLR